jgi:hypothetical protein
VEPIRRSLFQPLQEALSSLSLPWRVALTLAPLLLLALVAVPRLFRLALELVARALEWLVRGYAWAEYRLVRLVRRSDHQLWGVVGALDDGMEALAVRGPKRIKALGHSKLLGRVLRSTVVCIAVLPLLCWYVTPKVEPGTELRSRLRQGVAWTASFDIWVRTGTWPQPREKVAAKKKPQKEEPGRTARRDATP